ncbi:hypothetical protein Tco_1027827, partial [Tanacetum coccineum]
MILINQSWPFNLDYSPRNHLEPLDHVPRIDNQWESRGLPTWPAKTAELQASLGQLQGRPGGNGDQGATFPRSMRLDVPKFSGVDPERWIFAINEYFSLLNTSIYQRLRIVRFNMEGAVAEWFQWMTRNGLITTWARFEESAKNHFGPSKYEDPNQALSKLLQLGTVGQAIDAKSTSDNDAQDQASEIETKMLVEGKQDKAKVVVVADEQNSDEPDVLEGNGVI